MKLIKIMTIILILVSSGIFDAGFLSYVLRDSGGLLNSQFLNP